MLRHFLPNTIQAELFGDREKYGLIPWENDQDWEKYQTIIDSVYIDTQRNGLQEYINNAGYRVLDWVNLDNLQVSEIGPGSGYHLAYFNGLPKHFHTVDIRDNFKPHLEKRCSEHSIPFSFYLIDSQDSKIPLDSESQDIVLSFYALEHIYPLKNSLDEIFRILKPGGKFIGTIPAEGGIAWGVGRWLTSNRIFKEKYQLDLRKIICWEHRNMCDEIIKLLKQYGSSKFSNWPIACFPQDLSLLIKFMITKS